MGRLTDADRDPLPGVMKTLQGSSQYVRRAPRLLKADADGPTWTAQESAEAWACRRQPGAHSRQRLVMGGVARTLYGAKPRIPPRPKRWGARKQRRAARDGGASPHPGAPIGPGGGWPSRSSPGPASTRSAMSPRARGSTKRQDVTPEAGLGAPSGHPWCRGRVHGTRMRDFRAAL